MTWRLVLVLAFLSCKAESAAPPVAAQIDEGQELYRSYGCAVCHGKSGAGDGPSSDAMNPRPRDFRDAAAFTRGDTIDAIASTIETGVAGGTTGMVAYPQIPSDERMKIAAYIASLARHPGR